MMSTKMQYIVIEGNIGAGKTSLAHLLARELKGMLVLEEFAENAFLPQFYENPAKYAFPLELSFLAARYHQLSQVFANQENSIIISDYHFHKSHLFASVNLDPAEMGLYDSFYRIISHQIPDPQLVVYLDKKVERLQSNIKKRGREYEAQIGDEYLNNISGRYDRFLESQNSSKILRIDTNSIDFVANADDLKTIVNAILPNIY